MYIFLSDCFFYTISFWLCSYLLNNCFNDIQNVNILSFSFHAVSFYVTMCFVVLVLIEHKKTHVCDNAGLDETLSYAAVVSPKWSIIKIAK